MIAGFVSSASEYTSPSILPRGFEPLLPSYGDSFLRSMESCKPMLPRPALLQLFRCLLLGRRDHDLADIIGELYRVLYRQPLDQQSLIVQQMGVQVQFFLIVGIGIL